MCAVYSRQTRRRLTLALIRVVFDVLIKEWKIEVTEKSPTHLETKPWK